MNYSKIPLAEINSGNFSIKNTQAKIFASMKLVFNYDSTLHRRMYSIESKKSTMNFFHQVRIDSSNIPSFIRVSLGAYYSINIDQRVMNLTKNNMTNSPSRYTFDEAQVDLHSNDLFPNESRSFLGSYLQSNESRYLRSILTIRNLQRNANGWKEKSKFSKDWSSFHSFNFLQKFFSFHWYSVFSSPKNTDTYKIKRQKKPSDKPERIYS